MGGCDDWLWWSRTETGIPNAYREFTKLNDTGQQALLEQMDAFRRGQPLRRVSKITKGILELRANVGKNQFRILFLMAGRDAVVLTAFAKKDQSLPRKDVTRAERRLQAGHHMEWPQS